MVTLTTPSNPRPMTATPTQDLILAIDVGTQSVRALLFDLRGNLLAKARLPIEPYFSTAPGSGRAAPRSLLAGALPGLPAALERPGPGP